MYKVRKEIMRDGHKSAGWSWSACLLGPFWYLSHGMVGKGFVLLIIDLFTIGFAIPIVAIYSGFRGKPDEYERQLQHRSRINPDDL